MKDYDWIGRELRRSQIEPASEDFYQEVWKRIRTAERASLFSRRDNPIISIGAVCWKAFPIFAALLLVVGWLTWFYPPDFGRHATSAEEIYALDSDVSLSDAGLFYQIVRGGHTSAMEGEQ